jgi:cytidyltransferase-like protein
MTKPHKNKVMLFGSFDILHNGHFFLFKKAHKYGDLIIVVAQDNIIKKTKGKKPHKEINERIGDLEKYFIQNKKEMNTPILLIGDNENEKWSAIKKYKPSIVVVGYDQKDLKEALKKIQKIYKFKIVQISSFKPNVYKSSILRKLIKNMT